MKVKGWRLQTVGCWKLGLLCFDVFKCDDVGLFFPHFFSSATSQCKNFLSASSPAFDRQEQCWFYFIQKG